MQKASVVIGAQWGDEGKGKVVDFLAKDYDITVRYNGGNNAGHTVKANGKTYKFHLIPSGAIQRKKVVLGNGMVIDPRVLTKEMESLRKSGIPVDMIVSEKAHVIMDYHIRLDCGSEEDCRKKIGTTGRGIGPAYSDKMRRTEAIRVVDLVSGDFEKRLQAIVKEKKKYMEANRIRVDEKYFPGLAKEYKEYAKKIRPYVGDVSFFLNNALDSGKSVLMEGAQGTLLDVDHGTYPFVSSSNSVAGGACTGAGIGPGRIGEVIGVSKAYTTRVGEGPFPTELLGSEGEKLRGQGMEYGTTTGRPRRCGWLDLVVLKYAKMVNGLTSLAMTKLDVLGGMERIKVCTQYELSGEKTDRFPVHYDRLRKAKPVYSELPGWKMWQESEVNAMVAKGYKSLPENARKYVEFTERSLGIPVRIVSIGPDRDSTIVRK